MKKILYIIMFSIICSFSYAQSIIQDELISTTYILEGYIDNRYPLKMYLTINDNNTIEGKYYYQEIKKYIQLEGVFSNNSVEIDEYLMGSNDEKQNIGKFIGKFNIDDVSFVGAWVNIKTNRALPLKLKKPNGIATVEVRQVSLVDKPHNFVVERQYFIIEGAEKVANLYTVDKAGIEAKYKEFMTDYDVKSEEYKHVHEEVFDVEFKYADENIISLWSNDWAYTGGAHGYFASAGNVYNVKTGKLYNSADLFSSESRKDFSIFIQSKLYFEYGKDNFFDIETVEVNDNYYVDIEGIHYTYTPYEIAPWSSGQPRVSFTYREAKSYVKKGSPLLYLFK